MRTMTSIVITAALFVGCAAHASGPASLNTAALRAYADKPWNKAELMNTTLELGRYHGVPVVAEFPCSDVCPQYTVRIIHYRLTGDASCPSIGGVEESVLVPIAIAVRSKTVCVPEPLVATGQYYTR